MGRRPKPCLFLLKKEGKEETEKIIMVMHTRYAPEKEKRIGAGAVVKYLLVNIIRQSAFPLRGRWWRSHRMRCSANSAFFRHKVTFSPQNGPASGTYTSSPPAGGASPQGEAKISPTQSENLCRKNKPPPPKNKFSKKYSPYAINPPPRTLTV